jgi:hypothetical protein
MASDFHRRAACRLLAVVIAPLGSLLVSAAVVGAAAIVAQMSGCCGSAPTHGCKFIESPKDAHVDMASDAPIPCGIEMCVPGMTNCCFEPMNVTQPFRCISPGTVCKGPTGNCAGAEDCPAGSNQICCGSTQAITVQCQDPGTCPGDFNPTAIICRSDMECPPNLPKCTMFTVQTLAFYACSTPGP